MFIWKYCSRYLYFSFSAFLRLVLQNAVKQKTKKSDACVTYSEFLVWFIIYS